MNQTTSTGSESESTQQGCKVPEHTPAAHPRSGCAGVLGIRIGRWRVREFIDFICESAASRRPLWITYVNAHNMNVAARDPNYRRILDSADAVYADGQSIVWASRWLRCRPPLPQRVNAGDFFPELIEALARRKLRVYLAGSEPGVAQACQCRLERRLGARATGVFAGATDGFWGRGGEQPDENAALQAIRDAHPDILLVGMGVPRQEFWAWRRASDLNVPVIWCVGALFEYYAGRRARAPRWMRAAGLEWAFRLALEPRRLAHRYLLGNLLFILRVLRRRDLPAPAAQPAPENHSPAKNI